MRRTQIYLDKRQVSRLQSAARASHRSMSEIIREAIDEKLERTDAPEFDSAVRNAAGIWADRNDLESTAEYVRRIRQDRRGRLVR